VLSRCCIVALAIFLGRRKYKAASLFIVRSNGIQNFAENLKPVEVLIKAGGAVLRAG
jgi:hypothetical protein